MAIAIRCRHCGKAYNLKDELKGKRVACTNPNCKKVFTVEAPAGVATAASTPAKPVSKPANVDELAAALFSEAKAEEVKPEAAPATATIRVKCQHCDHENIFDAKMAGKHAPCQNEECGKLIKVP